MNVFKTTSGEGGRFPRDLCETETGSALRYWDLNVETDAAKALFRVKAGTFMALDKGMAIFSPDCNYFWSTPYKGGSITVFATKSGKSISSFSGYYSAWSPNATLLYMSRMKKTYQLRSWSPSEGEKGPIVEVRDYCGCYLFADGVYWFPAK